MRNKYKNIKCKEIGPGGVISKRGVQITKEPKPSPSQTSSSTSLQNFTRPVPNMYKLHTSSNAKTHNIKVVGFFKTNSTI